jgi:prophage regulatory protein
MFATASQEFAGRTDCEAPADAFSPEIIARQCRRDAYIRPRQATWSFAMPTDAINPPRPDLDRSGALFLRIGTVMRLTGLGRSTIYRLMADEEFPSPVRLTKRVVAWRRTDLERWSEGRPTVTH